jgi:protein involved in sex pheromone biosynthesis
MENEDIECIPICVITEHYYFYPSTHSQHKYRIHNNNIHRIKKYNTL